MRIAYIALIFSLVAVVAMQASAYSPSGAFYNYISVYLPNSTLSQYTYTNLSTNGSNYVIMESILNQSSYLIVNSSGGVYRMVTNSSSISSILSAYVSSRFQNLTELSYLQMAMHKYLNKANVNLTDCVVETGTNPNTNNLQSASEACGTIPNCHKALTELGGPDSPFGYGLVNFSIYYNILNSSANNYFNLLTTLNTTNAGSNIAGLAPQISNIQSVAANLNQNPLFPPPQNANFQNCNAGLAPSKQPWYCTAVGYCGSINFDPILLANISATQKELSAKVPTSATLNNESIASARSANAYLTGAAEKANATIYYQFLNSTYPIYNTTVTEITALLSKTQNSTLSNSLSAIESSFANIQSNSVLANITKENKSFYSLLSSVTAKYKAVNQTYSSSYGRAVNDTLDAVAAQLNFKSEPVRLAVISSQLQTIDQRFATSMNSIELSQTPSQLQLIGVQLLVFGPPITLGHIVKVLDGGFIGLFEGGSNAAVVAKISSAPIYAAIESLIIGLVLVLIFYLLTYRRFSKRKKMRHNKRAKRAWLILFIVLIALVLLYSYLTYNYAASANGFLPFSYFTGTLKSSKSVYVVLNGTSAYSNLSTTACASAISNVLKSENKSVSVVDITNYTCIANGNVSPLGVDCYDHALAAGTPIIMLSSSGSGITYKGAYGYVLYASGSAASGNSCLVAQLIKRKG